MAAICDMRNAAGIRLLEKAGLRQEGEFLQDRRVRNEWVDTAYYACWRRNTNPDPFIGARSSSSARSKNFTPHFT